MIWWQTQLSCIYHVNVHDEHFLVRILRMYCCRLIQPVKMYAIWYMMLYLKKDIFCKEHDLFGCFVIFKTVCPSSVFGRSGRRPSSSGHVPCGTRSCICTCFVRTWNLRSRARSHLAIACTIARTIVFDRSRVRTPGLARDRFFMGPGFESLPVQHDLFVGPGFDSLALIACF